LERREKEPIAYEKGVRKYFPKVNVDKLLAITLADHA
jgi:hypothetical protein